MFLDVFARARQLASAAREEARRPLEKKVRV
jgi:hypothetical protein